MTFRSVLLASAMLALPLAAANAQVTGPYISLGGGANFMQQEPVKSAGGGSVSGTNVHTDPGGIGVVAGGWGFGNGIRAELEFSYRYNSLNQLSFPGGTASLKGSEQKYGPMVNVLYDFYNFGVPMAIVPYIGVGAGYQWTHENITSGGPFGVSTGDTAGALAVQGILGAAMPVSPVPGLSITAEYRFMALPGERSYSFGGANVKLGNDFNHSILVGLRYEFGVAPPPAAPMPVADMGAKTFLVFFDWDRADLTARSQGIVHDAAAYSTHSAYTRIDVDGNTDTSGTPQYNMGLSERRAHRVADELVRDGVPQNAISMHAYGETKLLVPTGPNVREPQNRRVEIIFH